MGVLVRDGSLLPLHYTDWRYVPAQYIKKVWEEIKAHKDADDSMERWFIQSLGRKWQGWKCEAKRQGYMPYDNDADILAHKPSRVTEEQWQCLVYYWNDGDVKDKDAGKKPTHIDTFIKTHTRKDGGAVNEETYAIVHPDASSAHRQMTTGSNQASPEEIGPSHQSQPEPTLLPQPNQQAGSHHQCKLLDKGNSKWKFLDGVKALGALPPRQVIVQQFICDRGVLEALCNYASPSKKFHLSKAVISFCTVVVEVLGSLTTLDDDVVKRVLPYVLSGLQLDAKGGLDLKVWFEDIILEMWVVENLLFASSISCALGKFLPTFTLSIIEAVPVKQFVNRIVSKLLYSCMRSSQKKNEPISSESGSWAKQILISINKMYPSEFLGAVYNFMEDAKVQSKNDGSIDEILCRMLDGNLDLSIDVSDSKIRFVLEHPKVVDSSTLSGIHILASFGPHGFSCIMFEIYLEAGVDHVLPYVTHNEIHVLQHFSDQKGKKSCSFSYQRFFPSDISDDDSLLLCRDL
ncbi:hypothetical protein RHGRI_007457 [Rhododendron griersonianum]|uniref:Uncharacterized protein n=1 Tax=Rhododendron griersonianum TaxID=479676 RepID=A0AAV6KWT7_9ERIC|nr:hypothetical protein RHGRI_007457 [Rhododendron griersonianum]